MANVSLKYISPAGIASDPMIFDARIFLLGWITDKIVDKTLRRRKFAHLMDNRRTYQIIISADQLADPEKKTFMDELHGAVKVEISIDGGLWREIIIPGGAQPVTYIQNSKSLPEIAYTVEEAEPTWPGL